MGSRKPDSGSVVAHGLRVSGDIKTDEPLCVEGLVEGNLGRYNWGRLWRMHIGAHTKWGMLWRVHR